MGNYAPYVAEKDKMCPPEPSWLYNEFYRITGAAGELRLNVSPPIRRLFLSRTRSIITGFDRVSL